MKGQIFFQGLVGTFFIGLLQIASAEPLLNQDSRVGTNGIGPVHIGMTVKEAEKASGRPFIKGDVANASCYYSSAKGLAGVRFMVLEERIARVDVDNPRVMTLRGAKVGDSEARIKALYPGRIKVETAPYSQPGSSRHQLIFYPKDPVDQNYRVIFQANQGKVFLFIAGSLPAVEFVEGCY